MLSESRTCPACERRLSEGVQDVFCPECALRQALAAGAAAKPIVTGEKAKELDLASPLAANRQSFAMTKAPNPGDVILDYEILEKIGGNMGFVYKARHRLLHKIVALKIFPSEWITDAARLARFEREIRSIGKLAHPNLVTASDARSVDSWRLVAMEWIDGMDLQGVVETSGPLPVNAACEVVRQAALGLHSAHEAGVVHRDIKPSNLMITSGGSVKVIDMGLALAREETIAQVTQHGAFLGTVHYCAPEQLRDAATVDRRADVYGLGCSLYHFLAGKPPYAGRTTMAQLVQAHLNEPFPDIRKARPDVPEPVAKTLDRMTAKDPKDRFASTTEVADVLEPYARGGNLEALLAPKPHAVPARRDPATMTPITAQPVERIEYHRPARRRWLVAAAVLLILVALLPLAFILAPRDPVVVLMDTTAPGGVYEDSVRKRPGGTNAEDLARELSGLLPHSLHQVSLSSEWAFEEQVLAKRPKLIIVHRSSFFHSLNAELNISKNDPKWQTLYEAGDERMKTLIGYLGSRDLQTQFLVYSRGTDANWLKQGFHENWIAQIESRFPALKGRVSTAVIEGGTNGTFRDPKTAEMMRRRVKKILNIREKN